MSEPISDTAPETTQQPQEGEPEPFDAERAQQKIAKANAEAKNLRARLKELEPLAAKAKELEDANRSEIERAVEAARKEGAAQATAAANSRLIAAEARALAAEAQFRNPATAVRLLDLSEVSVTDTGEVDTDAIKAALTRLGEDEPYLLASGEGKPAPAAQAGIGVGASKAIPSTAQDKIAAGLARYMQ